jgi:hypothetical protein
MSYMDTIFTISLRSLCTNGCPRVDQVCCPCLKDFEIYKSDRLHQRAIDCMNYVHLALYRDRVIESELNSSLAFFKIFFFNPFDRE